MMARKNHAVSGSWLLADERRWSFAEPAMTIYMQDALSEGRKYHAHGRKTEDAVAGKPDAVKAARPVWRGAHGTGPSTKMAPRRVPTLRRYQRLFRQHQSQEVAGT